ncbi:ras-related protein Rab-10-like isoform X3 [Phyllobates terribilis]|uniref:ras-related protein Rab-10-like isoform X3 n=1 Tax=Phyllobates terribilis TaxID=111132 RepID=UPI003CCA8B16
MRKPSVICRSSRMAAISMYSNLVAKLVMTGDSNVGKTCIVSRYTEHAMPSYLSTVGIDFKTKTVFIDETPLKLQIWDTAGQERFHTLSVSYFRGAHGFILVYDITNSISFENTTSWMKDIKMLLQREAALLKLVRYWSVITEPSKVLFQIVNWVTKNVLRQKKTLKLPKI